MPVEVPSNCITGFFVHHNGDHLFEELQSKIFILCQEELLIILGFRILVLQSVEELNDLARQLK